MDGFELISGLEQMRMDDIMELLATTHWACKRPREQEQLAMEHSICYGAIDRESGKQIGFARVVTDFGTTYYLCDVIVSPLWQHKGVGRAIIETIQSDPRFRDLRGILVSRDAQGFYARFGFEKSDRGMVKPAAN